MLNNNIIQANDKVSLTTSVLDILSDPVNLSSIKVNSVKLAGDVKNNFEGLFDDQNQVMSLDLSGIIKTPGVYTMALDISIEGKKKTLSASQVFSIVKAVHVKDVNVGVTDDKQLEISKLDSVENQMKLPALTASAAAFDIFHVAFTVSPSNLRMHQTFIRFTNLETGDDVLFVSHDSGDYMHTSVSLGIESETFSYASGKYSVSILVGDSKASNAIEWIIGDVDFTFPSRPIKNHPLYTKALLHTSDNTLKALPEITHKMRPPAERATTFMSSLFTFLSVLPLVAFLGFMYSLGSNVSRLNSVSSILFVCCISAAILLYTGYWLGLPGFSFYQTIKYICLLAPLTVIIGRSALAHMVRARGVAEAAAEKKET